MKTKTLLATLVGAALAAPSFSVVEEGAGVVAIEDLMDASIDDLKDLPKFEVPPKGHYKLKVSLERKTVNDKPGIEAKCVVLETMELADSNDAAPEPGSKFGQLFFMDNEFGQGGFKGFAVPIALGLGMQGATISAVIARVQDVTIAATLKHRYHKEDKALPVKERRTYADLSNIEIL